MTTSKRTKARTGGPITGGTQYVVGERGPELIVPTAQTAEASPEVEETGVLVPEEPVLYWTGRPPKAGLPERDLFAADITDRSQEALIQTGAYTDVKPAEAVTEAEAESEEPEA